MVPSQTVSEAHGLEKAATPSFVSLALLAPKSRTPLPEQPCQHALNLRQALAARRVSLLHAEHREDSPCSFTALFMSRNLTVTTAVSLQRP